MSMKKVYRCNICNKEIETPSKSFGATVEK